MIDNEGPVDYAATSRPRAGLIVKDSRELPGLALMGLALAALVGGVTSAAMGSAGWALGFAAATVLLAAVGVTAVAVQRRRAVRLAAGRHAR